MSKAPDQCLYCDGQGNSRAGGECGFCDHGKPLDTQADWDASWGRIFDHLANDPEWRRQMAESEDLIRRARAGDPDAVAALGPPITAEELRRRLTSGEKGAVADGG